MPTSARETCPTCPVPGEPCLGLSCPRLCDLARTRADYRQMLVRKRGSGVSASGVLPLRVSLAVINCPQRGRLLTEQGCGCRTECRAGKGAVPGEVTWDECLACVQAGGPPGGQN